MVTDTIIVGQFLGPVPMSGVRVASPIVNMLNVLSMLVGVGGSTLVSIAMGKRRPEHASYLFSLSIVLSIAFGALFAIVVAPLSPAIAGAISSDPASVEYTATFLQIVSAASPVYILAAVMGMLLRSDACIRLSSVVLAAAGVANVIFDLIFIGGLGMGVAGSALATDMGMLVAVLLSILYFRWPKRTLKLVNPFVTARGQQEDGEAPTIAGETLMICKNGAASGLRLFLACVSLLFLNFIVGDVVGVMGIALMTVCGNIQLLAVAFFSAAGQAATPMEGVLFGERDYSGIRLLFRYVMKVTIASVAVIIAVICAFPGAIISLFCPNGVPVEGAEWMLRLYALGFLPLAVNYILTYYYNTIQQRKVSTALTICENLAIYLPAIWAFTSMLGLAGTVLSFVASELLTLGVVLLLTHHMRSKNNLPDLLLLPADSGDVVYEASSPVTNADAVAMAREVKTALEEGGAEPTLSLRTAMAVEELVAEAASRQEAESTVDVRVLAGEDTFTVSVRDNTSPFDPTAGGSAPEGEFDNLSVLKAIALNVNYACVLGLNQTVITIGKAGAEPGDEDKER